MRDSAIYDSDITLFVQTEFSSNLGLRNRGLSSANPALQLKTFLPSLNSIQISYEGGESYHI